MNDLTIGRCLLNCATYIQRFVCAAAAAVLPVVRRLPDPVGRGLSAGGDGHPS